MVASRSQLSETAVSAQDITPQERHFFETFSVRSPGAVQARNMAGCELAELVLSQQMGLDVSCSGSALLTLAVASGDPVQVLTMFRAAVEAAGGTFGFNGSVVSIAFRVDTDRAVLAVPGQESGGPVPFISVGEAGPDFQVDDAWHVLPLPSSVRPEMVQEVAALLRRTVLVGTVRGRAYVASNDRETLRDVLSLSDDLPAVSARLTVSDAELDAIRAVADRHGVDVALAPAGVLLQGDAVAVRDVVAAFRSVVPQPRDLTVSVAFLSFTTEQEAAFTASLSGTVASGSSGALVLSAPGAFSAVVDGLARRAGASIEARPEIVVRSGQDARFQSGQSVPITSETIADNGQVVRTVEYRDAGLILNVSPSMLADGVVEAVVSVEVSSVLDTGADQPSFDVQKINTVSRLGLGDVVILTGFSDTRAERSSRLGVLSGLRRFASGRTVQIVLSVNLQ